MFDKVVVDLSGKVLFFFFKMLTSQKFPTPWPDTNPHVGEGTVSGLCFFFADSAPMGFVWPHPNPTDSIRLWTFKHSCWWGAVSHDPEAAVCAASETSTGADSYSKANKSVLEVFSFKPRPRCFVCTCWLFHCSPHRFVVFNTSVQCSAPLLNKHDIHVSIHDHVD